MTTASFSTPSDADAERAAEIAYWAGRRLALENAAAHAARMHRLATIDNPRVRDICQRAFAADLHDPFNTKFVDELGDFRESPFGIVDGAGGNDALNRAAKRREVEAEKRRMSEAESYRRMLEAKSVLGTEVEKSQVYDELARLDDDGFNLPEIEA
jgi:hypothetical protein